MIDYIILMRQLLGRKSPTRLKWVIRVRQQQDILSWKGDNVPKTGPLPCEGHMGRLKPICVLSRRWGIQKGGKGTRTEVVTKATRLSAPSVSPFTAPSRMINPHPLFSCFPYPQAHSSKWGF
ncbi:hypothetical protein CDAR_36291 [Caerostris darwini]|uniref:Uncharacterized protein n=1 Tax=Caerostris darwini TaxID=1538125 RepID=A0AAV4R9Y9_9ARAC|nr:hypothetical protein CDAR_36291 [Caerostris darwini]